MEIVTIKNKKPKVTYKGYDLYLKTLNEFGRRKIAKINLKDKKFADVFRNHLFGLEGPKRLKRKWAKADEIFSKIFYGFSEIMNSYESLLDCEIYVKQYPNYSSFKKRKITRVRYLRYHIEKYFEEVYILKARLEAYANMVKKYFKNDTKIVANIDKLKKSIFSPLEGIIKTRGSHVHISRYTDPELDRLSSLELLNWGEKPIPSLIIYSRKIVYPLLRNNWAKRIKDNNKATKKLLDLYCDYMVKIVFDEKSDLKIK